MMIKRAPKGNPAKELFVAKFEHMRFLLRANSKVEAKARFFKFFNRYARNKTDIRLARSWHGHLIDKKKIMRVDGGL